MLIVLPGPLGLISLLPSVLWSLLWSLLWLLYTVMVPVLNYLTPPVLIQPVFGHLRNGLLKTLPLLVRSGWGRPGLLANWIEV